MKHDIEVSVFIIKEIKFLRMRAEEQFNLILQRKKSTYSSWYDVSYGCELKANARMYVMTKVPKEKNIFILKVVTDYYFKSLYINIIFKIGALYFTSFVRRLSNDFNSTVFISLSHSLQTGTWEIPWNESNRI